MHGIDNIVFSNQFLEMHVVFEVWLKSAPDPAVLRKDSESNAFELNHAGVFLCAVHITLPVSWPSSAFVVAVVRVDQWVDINGDPISMLGKIMWVPFKWTAIKPNRIIVLAIITGRIIRINFHLLNGKTLAK